MDAGGGTEASRLRALATTIVGRVGGLPAVRTLLATLAAYDLAGSGLVSGGLAYAALVALLPGLLLVLSIVGLVFEDPATRERLVQAIANVLPPLEDLARAALSQVAAGAVPTSIIALAGLVWGSSRFYTALDRAFSRLFPGVKARNGLERTIRGLALVAAIVALPVVVLTAGSITSWLLDRAPNGLVIEGAVRAVVQVATPAIEVAAFVVSAAAAYRLVPPARVSWRALLPPALLVGFTFAVFTQIFAFFTPRIVSGAAVYGAFVAAFVVLAWLSTGFTILMLGAAWTSVRVTERTQRPVTTGEGIDEPTASEPRDGGGTAAT